MYLKFALFLFIAAVVCSSTVFAQVTPAPTPVGTNIAALNATVDEAQSLLGKGQSDEALKMLNAVIQTNPTYALAYSRRAAVYFDKHQYDLALGDANKAIALDPKDAEAYTVRGGVKGSKNDLVGCVADQTQAIALLPNFVRPYYLRSLCNESLKKFQEVFDDAGKVMTMAPNYSGGYVEHGVASFSLAKYEQAIDDLQKAVDLDPSDQQAHDYFVAAVNGNRKFTADLITGRDQLAKATFEAFAERFTLFQKEMDTASTTKSASLNELMGYFHTAQLARLRTRFSDVIDDTKSGNAELIRLDEQHLKNHREGYEIINQLDAILKQQMADLKCTEH